MELSTTNGHINIDYLFIYQPHLFSCGTFSPYHGKVLACTVNNLFLHPLDKDFKWMFGKYGFSSRGIANYTPLLIVILFSPHYLMTAL